VLKRILENILIELKKIGRGIKKLRFFKFADIFRTVRLFTKLEKIVLLSLLGILLLDMSFGIGRFYIHHTKVVPAYGGIYSEGILGQPRFINPLLAQTQTDKDLTRLVFAGLYKYDDHGNIIPDLAESDMQLSENQKEYTVKLKPNLKWHDGQPITADDVVFTIQTLQNPDYKSPFKKLWQNISVQKIDPLTVKFTNTDISAPFETNLTLGILPKHIWAQITPENFYLAKPNLEPVGSGPYNVTEISKSVNGDVRGIKLQSYSNYPTGKPFIDGVDLKFYQSYEQLLAGLHTREVDSIGFLPFDKKTLTDLSRSSMQVLQIPVFQYQALFFNSKTSKVLASKPVRQALAAALDRNTFIKNVYSGFALPAYTPILPGQLGYDPNNEKLNQFDIANAEGILDKEGWVKNPQSGMRSKGAEALKFTITTNDFLLNVKSAEELQQQWKKIGADVSINTVNKTDFEKNNLRPRNFEALLFSVIT